MFIIFVCVILAVTAFYAAKRCDREHGVVSRWKWKMSKKNKVEETSDQTQLVFVTDPTVTGRGQNNILGVIGEENVNVVDDGQGGKQAVTRFVIETGQERGQNKALQIVVAVDVRNMEAVGDTIQLGTVPEAAHTAKSHARSSKVSHAKSRGQRTDKSAKSSVAKSGKGLSVH